MTRVATAISGVIDTDGLVENPTDAPIIPADASIIPVDAPIIPVIIIFHAVIDTPVIIRTNTADNIPINIASREAVDLLVNARRNNPVVSAAIYGETDNNPAYILTDIPTVTTTTIAFVTTTDQTSPGTPTNISIKNTSTIISTTTTTKNTSANISTKNTSTKNISANTLINT